MGFINRLLIALDPVETFVNEYSTSFQLHAIVNPEPYAGLECLMFKKYPFEYASTMTNKNPMFPIYTAMASTMPFPDNVRAFSLYVHYLEAVVKDNEKEGVKRSRRMAEFYVKNLKSDWKNTFLKRNPLVVTTLDTFGQLAAVLSFEMD